MRECRAPVTACGSRGPSAGPQSPRVGHGVFLQLSSKHRWGGTGPVSEMWPPSLADQDPEGSRGPHHSLASAFFGEPP